MHLCFPIYDAHVFTSPCAVVFNNPWCSCVPQTLVHLISPILGAAVLNPWHSFVHWPFAQLCPLTLDTAVFRFCFIYVHQSLAWLCSPTHNTVVVTNSQTSCDYQSLIQPWLLNTDTAKDTDPWLCPPMQNTTVFTKLWNSSPTLALHYVCSGYVTRVHLNSHQSSSCNTGNWWDVLACN